MANLAALRAAVLSLSAKNLTGGGLKSTPPAGARVNDEDNSAGQGGPLYPVSKFQL